MQDNEFRYEIGGKVYIQRPLVLGQIGQLIVVLKGIEITDGMGTMDIVALLDDRLPEAIAVILTEDGKRLKDKDIKSLAEDLSETLDVETAMEIVDRFFSLNPIASVLDKLTGTMKGIARVVTGLQQPSSPSPAETLPEGTGSSGGTPSKNASHTSKKDRGGGSSGKQ